MVGEKRKMVAFQLLFLVIVLCLLGFAACKKAAEVEETPAPGQERKAEPTRITDATVLSTYVWKQPTTIIEVEVTPADVTPTLASVDTKTIERGRTLYEKKGCIECHGAQAEGVDGKGATLAGTSLTEEEFEDILRTGGRGRLGNEHLFGTSAITSSGIEAVYTYLQSLAE
jgi:mono/diheme cytochrome c family protein